VADITVEVSSPGLVAYGSGLWGSDTYGGFDQIDVTVGSVDAFHLEGWGRLTWGSLVWGQDFEDSIVSVTTPGTPTTWGYNTWGYGGYGQITGAQIDQGEEQADAELNALVDASTNLITVSVTSIVITADANLNLTTNLLTTSVGFTQENVDANTIVELTAPGDLPWGTTYWGYGSWGNIGGMDVEQGGEEVVVPSVEVDVTGQVLTFSIPSIGQIVVTGDANLTLNTNLLTTSLGDEDATPNTIVTLSTNLLTSAVGSASGQALVNVDVTGVSATVSTGRLFITAWAVIDINQTGTWTVVDIAA